MVMSATYRQSAYGDKKLAAQDPLNLLYGQSLRHRWPAEMLRDNALAVSGLLSGKIGGAPAKPYEVALSFKPTGRDKGEGLYRRSLYTYWKRTAPAPVMMSLDASKREVCIVKRERTTSPLQALVLMNDTQFVEAARVFAAKLAKQHAFDRDKVIQTIFRTLTSRKPSQQELEILANLYGDQLTYFQANKGRAAQLLKVGDAPIDAALDANKVAAFTIVVSAVLNFDECVLKP